MVKVSHLAAAASGAGAALVALTPGTLVANNNSLQPPYNDLYSNYQFPNGFQSSPDEYLQNLAAGLSLTDDSNRFIRSVSDLDPDPDDGFSAVQRSMVRDDARRVRGLCEVQQAWMDCQTRSLLTTEYPPQVLY